HGKRRTPLLKTTFNTRPPPPPTAGDSAASCLLSGRRLNRSVVILQRRLLLMPGVMRFAARHRGAQQSHHQQGDDAFHRLLLISVGTNAMRDERPAQHGKIPLVAAISPSAPDNVPPPASLTPARPVSITTADLPCNQSGGSYDPSHHSTPDSHRSFPSPRFRRR